LAEPDGLADTLSGLLDRYVVEEGKPFRLADMPTAEKGGFDKATGKTILRARRAHLAELQERFHAQSTHGLLLVLQGMDTSGKDSLIRNVMSGVNPQGVRVTGFKQPTPEEVAHDYLWRIHRHVPARGEIAIFNRSHYEDVLVARVHADRLAAGGLEGSPKDESFWGERLKDIRHFERYLVRQGVIIVKLCLHISPDAQRKRLLRRLERPEKNWKFSESDLQERSFWAAYQQAYEQAIIGTSTSKAPWYVVPSDHKWFSRLVAMEALIAGLEQCDPAPPPPSKDLKRRISEYETKLRHDRVRSS